MNWFKKNTCFFLITCINVFNISKHQLHSSSVLAFSPNINKYDIFRYKSKGRKLFKKNKNYTNLVEDHHCIPRQWKDHQLLEKINFDINSSLNLIIMPNKKGKILLNLHPDSLVHQGGHHRYNLYVKENLDFINKYQNYDDIKYHFWLFLHHLKFNMKNNQDNIPWK